MRILVAGALGEVGSSVAAALESRGHVVVRASSRAPIDAWPDVVDLARAAGLVRDGDVDAVVNAAGRGDRRAVERTGRDATAVLAPACSVGGVPSVLLSTMRVMEGHREDFTEDAAPAPLTPYAEANARNEQDWWREAGRGAGVLRITNYFCPPSGPDTPQSHLLPWSLVTEAVADGRIGIRSGPHLTKEFVGAEDVATAVLAVVVDSSHPAVVTTTPGTALSMQDLADCVVRALARAGRPMPSVTFGQDSPPGPTCAPGWLHRVGWTGSLTKDAIEQSVTDWVLRWARPATGADEAHEGG